MRSKLVGNKVLLRPLKEVDLSKRALWTSDRKLCLLMGADPDEEPFESLEAEMRGNRQWLAERRRAGALVYAIVAEGVEENDDNGETWSS